MNSTLFAIRSLIRPILWLVCGYWIGRFVGWLIISCGLVITGCASSGIYNMSDTWCESHPTASADRCPGRP